MPLDRPLQASGKAAKSGKPDAANPARGKPSKKGKDGPSFGLGKGTGLMRSLIDSSASHWTSDSTQAAAPANGTVNGASPDALSQVVQLAQQLQGGGEEEAGQASVPETLGEPAGALDRRTATQLQQACKVCHQQLSCVRCITTGRLLRKPFHCSSALQQMLAC